MASPHRIVSRPLTTRWMKIQKNLPTTRTSPMSSKHLQSPSFVVLLPHALRKISGNPSYSHHLWPNHLRRCGKTTYPKLGNTLLPCSTRCHDPEPKWIETYVATIIRKRTSARGTVVRWKGATYVFQNSETCAHISALMRVMGTSRTPLARFLNDLNTSFMMSAMISDV